MESPSKTKSFLLVGTVILTVLTLCSFFVGKYPLTLSGLLSGDAMQWRVFLTLRASRAVIGAIGGKARRVNVIMPYLYESRQNIRSGRESLDCATALQELVSMGVENIITFDAHDARVQNATPLHGFETIQPSYQFIKALLNHEKGLHIDNDHFMIISPDEGSMNRAIYLANILGVDMGMYYKRLDYSKRINGDRKSVV